MSITFFDRLFTILCKVYLRFTAKAVVVIKGHGQSYQQRRRGDEQQASSNTKRLNFSPPVQVESVAENCRRLTSLIHSEKGSVVPSQLLCDGRTRSPRQHPLRCQLFSLSLTQEQGGRWEGVWNVFLCVERFLDRVRAEIGKARSSKPLRCCSCLSAAAAAVTGVVLESE